MSKPGGMPGRAIRTFFIQARMQEREQVSHCYQCMNRCDIATTPYCITGALVRAVTGDVDNALVLRGKCLAAPGDDHRPRPDGRAGPIIYYNKVYLALPGEILPLGSFPCEEGPLLVGIACLGEVYLPLFLFITALPTGTTSKWSR